tara:strand:+ start:349 stop:549 length:201 start_codon:yes stop_codon:yes gene_type:complete
MPSTMEDLEMARAVLSDIKYSIRVTKKACKTCGSERWDDWRKYQVRSNIDGALTRIEKAMELIDGK